MFVVKNIAPRFEVPYYVSSFVKKDNGVVSCMLEADIALAMKFNTEKEARKALRLVAGGPFSGGDFTIEKV